MTNYLATIERELIDARAEIVGLREQLDAKEKIIIALSDRPEIPLVFKLTGKERGVIEYLMTRGVCTKTAISDFVYQETFTATGDMPELKIIDVFICKIRKKLKPFGVTVDTVWGQGYSLSPDAKLKIKALANDAVTASVAPITKAGNKNGRAA